MQTKSPSWLIKSIKGKKPHKLNIHCYYTHITLSTHDNLDDPLTIMKILLKLDICEWQAIMVVEFANLNIIKTWEFTILSLG